jgi:hypothetical protein
MFCEAARWTRDLHLASGLKGVFGLWSEFAATLFIQLIRQVDAPEPGCSRWLLLARKPLALIRTARRVAEYGATI